MAEKNFNNVRIVNKHDIEANWLKATNFTPKQGELIVYDIDENCDYERIKIGDGVQNVNTLPFVDDELRTSLESLINDVDDKTDAVSALVGDVAVSEQISTAIDEIPVADNYNDGLMLSDDKEKLDAIESGAQKNVQSDWSQNDITSMEFVQNRPFYDGPLSITWDGVTKGHPAHMYDSSNYLIKITDTVFTDEELQTAKFVISENGATTEVVIADVWNDRAYTNALTGIWYNSMPCVYVVRQAGSLVGPGTYFLYNYSSKIYIQSLTVGSDTDVKKIDSKYIPDVIYVGPDEPTDPDIKVWINTAEEGAGVVPVLPRMATITLTAANWGGSSAPYSQTVEIATVTTASKIDLQPTVSQIVELQNEDIALMAENTDGIVTIYSFGGKPSADITMQVLLTEVSYV